MLQCHHCKGELSQWEAYRVDELPNSDRVVLYHIGCYAELKEARFKSYNNLGKGV